MWREFGQSLRRNGQLLVLVLGLITLTGISGSSIWLLARSQDDAAATVRSFDIQNDLTTLLLNLRRVESAQRGFLIALSQDYLTDYHAGLQQTMIGLERLRNRLAPSPEQQKMVAQVEPLIARKLEEMAETLRVSDSGQTERARDILRGGEGRVLIETVRQLLETGIRREQREIADQIKQSQSTAIWLAIATISGTVMVSLLGLLSIYLVRRYNRERDEAQSLLEETNAGLETTILNRTADLREANEEIQRFAYIVSHDLRSPLVNIMGFTSELENLRNDLFQELAVRGGAADKDEALGRDFDEALDFIKTSTSKMDRLINAVLKLSREGRRDFNPETVKMNALIETIGASLAHQTAETNTEIVVGPLPNVVSDRLALEQVFSNLIDNAVKYLRNGVPGRIEVTGASSGLMVSYKVRDNGRGIAESDHQRVFDLFRRAGAQDRPGEGIGLAHVRALVRRLGGTLTLASTLGEGSVFTVTLPRRWIARQDKDAA